jgi:itaconate CoA-transferase
MPEDFDPRMESIPAIGQHTDDILAELGYGEDQMARLREGGVI